MKTWSRIALIILSIVALLCSVMWFFACAFASGQLYDSYNMWQFFIQAPAASLILIGLLALSVLLFVLGVRKKS